jgi:ABC-type lipoprotein release transport system permease subunit
MVLLAAPLVAGVASWLPALAAAQQDPAVVLGEG